MIWSPDILNKTNDAIRKLFDNEKFIGIHLRNGPDWHNACQNLHDFDSYMASPQCLENTLRKVTTDLCLPSKSTILKDLEDILIVKLNKTIKNVYIATDKNPMINEIREHFGSRFNDLKLVHYDPWLPVLDLAILGKSEYFIGNCVSSFTSFVKRERDINRMRSSFWSMANYK